MGQCRSRLPDWVPGSSTGGYAYSGDDSESEFGGRGLLAASEAESTGPSRPGGNKTGYYGGNIDESTKGPEDTSSSDK